MESNNKQTIILAGGCFWGMEELFAKQDGVLATRVGYTGGKTQSPTYEDICKGDTDHAEAIEITFDPAATTLRKLLIFFFKMHDATTPNRQGNDIGTQYRSVIFYTEQTQKDAAQALITEIDAAKFLPAKIVTQLIPASEFYEAEDYHQDYLKKNPNGYTCHFVRDDWAL